MAAAVDLLKRVAAAAPLQSRSPLVLDAEAELRVTLASGVCFVAVTIAANWIWTALTIGADAISDDGMRTLMYLDAAAFYVAIFPLGVFVTAGSLVIVATGVMRKWIGYVGLADGIALFAAPLTVLEASSGGPLGLFYFLSLVGGAAWIVATGVSMARRREEPGPTPDGAAI